MALGERSSDELRIEVWMAGRRTEREREKIDGVNSICPAIYAMGGLCRRGGGTDPLRMHGRVPKTPANCTRTVVVMRPAQKISELTAKMARPLLKPVVFFNKCWHSHSL